MCIILKYFLYHFSRKAQGLCNIALKTGLNPYCRPLTRGPPNSGLIWQHVIGTFHTPHLEPLGTILGPEK